ncbi:MAG: hypothetical protein ABI563_04490 [Specibacter sp.]
MASAPVTVREPLQNTRYAHTSNTVVGKLRSAIPSGELLPGAKLSEQSLGGALGDSQDPGFHAPCSTGNARLFALRRDGHAAQAAAEPGSYLDAAQARVLAAMPAEGLVQ